MSLFFSVSNRSSTTAKFQEDPVIFLPGWGFDGQITTLIEPFPSWIYPTAFLPPRSLINELSEYINDSKFEKVTLVGWSMGAIQALEFTNAHPEKISGLELISMRNRWPKKEIDQIRNEMVQDYEQFLVGFYRKCFLGHRKAYKKFSQTLQKEYLEIIDMDILLQGLDYLQQSKIQPISGHCIHQIHGKNDIIAPMEQMAPIAEASIEIVETGGHMPFLSKACSLRKNQQKIQVQHHFSLAAPTYDSSAKIQKNLAISLSKDTILAACQPVTNIFEIGCGTGNYTALLTQKFPEAAILALDFSQEMVTESEKKFTANPKVQFICEDGELYLSHAAQQKDILYDVITSNATLQWFANHPRAFNHMASLLTPDGILLASTFGPNSLKELRQGLSEVFGKATFLAAESFLSKETLLELLQEYFSFSEVDEKILTIDYPSSIELLKQIKKTGTAGWRDSGPLALTRSRLERLNEWFGRKYGGCRVTYQIFILRCKK